MQGEDEVRELTPAEVAEVKARVESKLSEIGEGHERAAHIQHTRARRRAHRLMCIYLAARSQFWMDLGFTSWEEAEMWMEVEWESDWAQEGDMIWDSEEGGGGLVRLWLKDLWLCLELMQQYDAQNLNE